MSEKPNIREWLFRAIMFESEAEQFRSAGIRIGADSEVIEKSLLEESISPFSVSARKEALRMGRIYTLLNCFENSVRELIKERLQDLFSLDWWEKGVPEKVKKFAQARQTEEKKNTWLEGQKSELIQFIEFGHLSDIIMQNWENFSDLIPSQQWLKQRMDELEKARNYIAHNRLLLPTEFRRIEMYIADWNKTVGF